MSCDVGEATEGLENELWRRWSDRKVGEWAQLILQPFFSFSYVTCSSLSSPGEPPILLNNSLSLASSMFRKVICPFESRSCNSNLSFFIEYFLWERLISKYFRSVLYFLRCLLLGLFVNAHYFIDQKVANLSSNLPCSGRPMAVQIVVSRIIIIIIIIIIIRPIIINYSIRMFCIRHGL